MKFRGKVKLGDINTTAIGEIPPMKIEGLELEYECDYSLDEIQGVFDLSKQVVKELPTLVEDFTKAIIAITDNLDRAEKPFDDNEFVQENKSDDITAD